MRNWILSNNEEVGLYRQALIRCLVIFR